MQMGSLLSRWFDSEKCSGINCFGNSWSDQSLSSLERKIQAMDQRIHSLEQRMITTEEENTRLHNKWTSLDEKLHQYDTIQQGNHQMVLTRLRSVESMAFDHCEHLDDDIIVVEER